jgi:Na+/proline symporter
MQGYLLILAYAVIMIGLAVLCTWGAKHTKDYFLVADRKISKWPLAFSIAATWMWAPALFVAAQKAYQQGVVGLFWFSFMNIATLAIFGACIPRIRKLIPKGYTLAGYMLERYGKRVHSLFIFELLAMAVCAFGVQLLAGGKVVALLTGIPFSTVTILLIGIPLVYTVFGGFKASVMTDYLQSVVIFSVVFLLIPWVVSNAGGIKTVMDGLGGLSGEYTNLFDIKGWEVFIGFGLSVSLGLFAGPWGDQTYWQRAFAGREETTQSAFYWSAFIFALAPLSLSILGFVAAGTGFQASDASLVNVMVVAKFLPTWTLLPFCFMLLSGLLSTVDSHLSGTTALVGHDLMNRWGMGDLKGERWLQFTRWSLIPFALLGLGIANIPGMQILYFWLTYGILRAAVTVPAIMTLFKPNITEKGIFWGIVLALGFGFPLFSYGNWTGHTLMAVAGTLIVFATSTLIPLLTKEA